MRRVPVGCETASFNFIPALDFLNSAIGNPNPGRITSTVVDTTAACSSRTQIRRFSA